MDTHRDDETGSKPSPRSRPAPFSVHEETADDGTCILSVHGELDVATAPVLGQRIRRPLFWKEVTRVVVDLSETTFIDSSGTRTLILSHAHARALDRVVLFVCPDSGVMRRLRAYGLIDKLPLYPSREEALAA